MDDLSHGPDATLCGAITGASRGLGRAIALAVAPRCKSLLLTARDELGLAAVLAELVTYKQLKGHVVGADLSRSTEVEALCNHISQDSSPLDFLVLNAGYYQESLLSEVLPGDIRENLEVHCVSNLQLIAHAKQRLKRAASPRVILIGSTAAYEPYPSVPTYGMIKWALRGLAVNLRKELAPEGIGVTFLSPGPMWTDMWEGEDAPRSRLLEPEDVAAAVPFLLSLRANAVIDELLIRPMDGDLHG